MARTLAISSELPTLEKLINEYFYSNGYRIDVQETNKGNTLFMIININKHNVDEHYYIMYSKGKYYFKVRGDSNE